MQDYLVLFPLCVVILFAIFAISATLFLAWKNKGDNPDHHPVLSLAMSGMSPLLAAVAAIYTAFFSLQNIKIANKTAENSLHSLELQTVPALTVTCSPRPRPSVDGSVILFPESIKPSVAEGFTPKIALMPSVDCTIKNLGKLPIISVDVSIHADFFNQSIEGYGTNYVPKDFILRISGISENGSFVLRLFNGTHHKSLQLFYPYVITFFQPDDRLNQQKYLFDDSMQHRLIVGPNQEPGPDAIIIRN